MTTDAAPGSRRRDYRGPAFLSVGFRPLFLLAGIWAPVALVLSLWLILGGSTGLPIEWAPVDWHLHEMLFGYVAAAIGGFLLTAIPNWTGRLPVRGTPLLGLALLWLAGRIGMLSSGWIGLWPAAVLDLLFLIVLGFVAAREIAAAGGWRNLPVVAVIGVLLVSNALFHAEVIGLVALSGIAARLGIAAVVLLIALIGGRIVPSFTRNWLVKRGVDSLPAPFDRFDKLSLGLTLLSLAIWAARPEGHPTAIALGIAALANAVRLARWQGQRTAAEPLLAVLHLGFGWVPVGLALLGAAAISASVPQVVGMHALTVGAMATMTLAVMSRATLGHTGRALTASPGLTAAFGLITVAALCRIASPMVPDGVLALLTLSAGAWIVAFVLFVYVCGPLLVLPRPVTG